MEKPTTKFTFHGKGGDLFKLQIVNFILTVITLGIYYPWARAASLKYFYTETEMGNSRFTFHGTGLELFKGWLKTFAILIPLMAVFGYGVYELVTNQNFAFYFGSIALYFVAFIFILPAAINGAIRYRMSRTSWRGIRFGYEGKYSELLKIMLKGGLMTIITFGIYGSWLSVQIREYVLSKLKVGDLRFEYKGHGGDLFMINLKGGILLYPTLFMYYFRWQSHLIKFFYENIWVFQNNNRFLFKVNVKGFDIFKISFTNLLIIVFTLGLGTPWAVIRQINFFMSRIELDGELDFNTFVQANTTAGSAIGEELVQEFDLGII